MAYKWSYDPRRGKVDRPSFAEAFRGAAGQALGYALVNVPSAVLQDMAHTSLQPGGNLRTLTDTQQARDFWTQGQDLDIQQKQLNLPLTEAQTRQANVMADYYDVNVDAGRQDIGFKEDFHPLNIAGKKADTRAKIMSPNTARMNAQTNRYQSRTQRGHVKQQGELEKSRQYMADKHHQEDMAFRREQAAAALQIARAKAARRGNRQPAGPSKWETNLVQHNRFMAKLTDPANRGKVIEDGRGNEYYVDPDSAKFAQQVALVEEDGLNLLRGWRRYNPDAANEYVTNVARQHQKAGAKGFSDEELNANGGLGNMSLRSIIYAKRPTAKAGTDDSRKITDTRGTATGSKQGSSLKPHEYNQQVGIAGAKAEATRPPKPPIDRRTKKEVDIGFQMTNQRNTAKAVMDTYRDRYPLANDQALSLLPVFAAAEADFMEAQVSLRNLDDTYKNDDEIIYDDSAGD